MSFKEVYENTINRTTIATESREFVFYGYVYTGRKQKSLKQKLLKEIQSALTASVADGTVFELVEYAPSKNASVLEFDIREISVTGNKFTEEFIMNVMKKLLRSYDLNSFVEEA